MRLARPAALILALSALALSSLTTSALAVECVGTPLAYSQLRQDYPQINDAIAAAPQSDLHGTFNRLSALFNRAPIDAALCHAGTNGQLPANFVRNLEATLIDLQEDLGKDDVAGLTAVQKADILQVVRIYAFRRSIEFWEGGKFAPCPTACPITEPEHPCHSCSALVPVILNGALNDTVAASRPMYTTVYNSIPVGDRAGLTAPGDLTVENYIGSVETMAVIKGVESIDD